MTVLRRWGSLWLSLLLLLWPATGRADPLPAAPGSPVVGPVAYAPTTGHHLVGAFLTFWRAYGGAALLGYPLGEATRVADGRWLQVTERAVLALPPAAYPADLTSAPLVSVEPLGRDLVAGRGHEPPFRPVPAPLFGAALWFAATGHTLANGFQAHWLAHDGPVTLGSPLSEEFVEDGLIVQWFERGRLEYDPATGSIRRGDTIRLAPDAAALASPPAPPVAGAVPLDHLPPLPSPSRLAPWSGRGFGLGREAAAVLAPVGKDRPLRAGAAPPDLVPAYQGGLVAGLAGVRRPLLADLADLAAAARARGLTLTVLSGYRSPAYQAALLARAARELTWQGYPPDEAAREANRLVARPGESEHHLGTAIDFNSLEQTFAATPTGRFLAEEGWRYGFVLSYPAGAEARTGYSYEPWHLRWVGRPLAAALYANGYAAGGAWSPGQPTLQEYLEAAHLLLPPG